MKDEMKSTMEELEKALASEREEETIQSKQHRLVQREEVHWQGQGEEQG